MRTPAQEDFRSPEDHFEQIVKQLSPEQRSLFNSYTHVRVEAAFRDRHFVVYRMQGGLPQIIDRIAVQSFSFDLQLGSSCVLYSHATQRCETIRYVPTQPFGYEFFLCLPVSGKIRWAVTDTDPAGSYSFNLVVKVRSRRHLREAGIVYCETPRVFDREFGTAKI